MAMEQDTGIPMKELRVDGGPTRNRYLMQFQSDISGKKLRIPAEEELSGIGAAYMAGIAAGLYQEEAVSYTHLDVYKRQHVSYLYD